MMKCVLALVVLAHVSYCQTCVKYVKLNNEMMDRLEDLDKLYQQGEVNITYPGLLSTVPDSKHRTCCCQGQFIRKLGELLRDLSLPEKFEDIVIKLEGNLNYLEGKLTPSHLSVRGCKEIPLRNATMVFAKYRTFLKKVNGSIGKSSCYPRNGR